jgi:hypothetical protein
LQANAQPLRKQKAPPAWRGFSFIRCTASAALALLAALAGAILLLLLAGLLAALLLLLRLLALLLLLTRLLVGVLDWILIHLMRSSWLVRSPDFNRSRPQPGNNARAAHSFPFKMPRNIEAKAFEPAATAFA